MTLLEELKLRGFIHQCTDEKGLKIELQKTINFYIGFDCTAKSLHVGSLIQIMMMRIFQKYGHTPLFVLRACRWRHPLQPVTEREHV